MKDILEKIERKLKRRKERNNNGKKTRINHNWLVGF